MIITEQIACFAAAVYAEVAAWPEEVAPSIDLQSVSSGQGRYQVKVRLLKAQGRRIRQFEVLTSNVEIDNYRGGPGPFGKVKAADALRRLNDPRNEVQEPSAPQGDE